MDLSCKKRRGTLRRQAWFLGGCLSSGFPCGKWVTKIGVVMDEERYRNKSKRARSFFFEMGGRSMSGESSVL